MATWRRALAAAAALVEDEYTLTFVTTACLGTMVSIADWDADERLTMYQHDPGPLPLPA